MSAGSPSWRQRTAALGVVVVLTVAFGQAVATADPGAELPPSPQETPVAVQDAPETPLPDNPNTAIALTSPAEAHWPEPASADLDLSADGGTPAQAAARVAGTPVPVEGTPVAVTVTGDTAQRRAAAQSEEGAKVRVEVEDRADSKALVGNGVVFSVADRGNAAGKPLDVTFDYRSFADAFGGGFGSRLKLSALPACALSTPDKAECRVETPVENAANNTEARSLSGTVSLDAEQPAVFAVSAAAGSSTGTFAATSLAAAGSWNAGGSSGDFTYGYPLRVPPAVAGSVPSVSLGYSAQSVDGRTSASNNQASWLGDGWDASPGGFVERSYKSCSQDLGGNNGQTKTGDQCWATENATISLVGVSGKLVKDKTTGKWRPESDDGARIELLTGAANGDEGDAGKDVGEHWKVTTPDGTQYFLGLNRLPGWSEGKPETNSAWTVPVYGNNTGEPCNKGTFDSSWCQQAYRWNLDYVVDPNGNVTTYYYNKEVNHYGRNADPAKTTPYVREGYLNRIEYGLRADNPYATPVAKVDFETAERCLPSDTVDCAPDKIKTSPGSWPDVPADQLCAAGEQCTQRNSPSFFSRKRLTKVITRISQSGGWQDVDSWKLEHAYLPTGDGNGPSLNLSSIVHSGHVGGTITLPATTFAYKALANRVDGVDHGMPWTRYRINRITGETGAVTEVTYSDPDCVPGSRMPEAPDKNTLRCYPVWWSPDGAPEPIQDWFHKYVVTSVSHTASTGGSAIMPTYYEYKGAPAWHFDENDFAQDKHRTWSQWRGYETVRITKGATVSAQSASETVYFRGMHGDKLSSGTRSVDVENSEGEPHRDDDRLRGAVREMRQYNGAELVSASVNDPYLPETPTAEDAAGRKAFVSGVAAVRGRSKLADGSWRRTKVVKTFNAEGIPTTAEDHGDLAVTGDESCTRTEHARNETAWMLTYAKQVETVKGTCDVQASPGTILSSARSSYDGQEHGAAPTKGLITKAEVLDGWDSAGQKWITASTSTYDGYGRPLEITDSGGHKSRTEYIPATGAPAQIKSTNPLGHTATEHVEAAWGASVASVDANNRRSDLSYDALGRLVAAWTPGHDKNAVTADAVFEYHYNTTQPSVVVTKQRQDDGGYLTSYTLYDGLMRQRQTQIPTPYEKGGRQITDIFYDSRGLAHKTNGLYYNTEPPSDKLALTFDNKVPNQTVTEHDGMGRVTAAIFRVDDVEKWRTTTAYSGDQVHTTPPAGSPATTIINDAQGRTTEKRQYENGIGSTYDATKYTYNAAGLLETVTDPAGNTWRYGYDLRGRKVSTDDPDTGRSTIAVNVLGQITSTTDAEGRTVANTYDQLGRPTARYQDSPQGTKLAEWEYDSVQGGIGMPALSRRLVNGAEYTTRTTGYDDAGRPTGTEISIPEVEGVLGTTYQATQDYTYTGKPASTGLLDVISGDELIVEGETLTHYYDNANGSLEQTVGQQTYVTNTDYSAHGEVIGTVRGENYEGAKQVAVTNSYEVGTRRLVTSEVHALSTRTTQLANRNYAYDASGNITRIADAPSGTVPDIQCFAYDHLRRMTDAWTPSTGDCNAVKSTAALGGAAPYWHSWTFDKTGNRLTETQHAAAGDTVRTTAYPAAGQPQPHTATSVTTTSPTGDSIDTFAYDRSGNTTSRLVGGDRQVLEYDVEGKVSKVRNPDGKESTYLYDANGSRLISREPSATTLYVFGQEIRLEKGTSKPSWTRQYSHGGEVVAVRNSVSGLKWVIADHQGTNQMSVHPDTLEPQRRRQTPYGEARGGLPSAWPDRLGFVGGRNDESGLTQVGARLYDGASGRFLTADPVIDNNDPQQMNGYAYSNNSPVTFSDPTGLRHCGIDGVLCGPRIEAIHGSPEEYEAARQAEKARQKGWQQQPNAATSGNVEQQAAQDRRAAGISDVEYQNALANAHKTKWDVIKEVAWEVIKDISGWNDIVDCFSRGDILACGGLVFDLVPWGKVGRVLEAGYKAYKAVDSLVDTVRNARAILRRVDDITAAAERAVLRSQQRKLGGGSASCPNHSFVGATKVVMADGSEKPISEVELGDQVKATDPESGETTAREVVATFVHSDEGDMTRLVVRGESGENGTVDATSWHPVWVDAKGRFVNIGELAVGDRLTSVDGTSPEVVGVQDYTHFEPVYDLTVEGVHTYYVLSGVQSTLVHNCDSTLWEPNRPDTDNEPQEWIPDDVWISSGENLLPGEYHYVVMPNRSVRAFHDGTTFENYPAAGHTSLGRGGLVSGAGTFEVDSDGSIAAYDNHSGHYKPDRSIYRTVTSALLDSGFDVSRAQWTDRNR
ncbi:RHS repeat-associated core domain-containing protein [Actinosynnema mirum]|uniref:YD repeat protein n=1 Tax=Actinosynnema mirum (strain ATCC 29888 / DSM 43827 / JCM 3225 / NBRC 14064 / NCIMB 13271 / NRRL B-12336 / IMRU 3971 / 101) TaxID=446462 RepID=C6WQK5_ACTMD|nr:RHS repeat-associated core domain-containing protein [Actinosynnema mirum]ACU38695.1 YD repeat protein [Actinosynnema mirum DSM 43827]